MQCMHEQRAVIDRMSGTDKQSRQGAALLSACFIRSTHKGQVGKSGQTRQAVLPCFCPFRALTKAKGCSSAGVLIPRDCCFQCASAQPANTDKTGRPVGRKTRLERHLPRRSGQRPCLRFQHHAQEQHRERARGEEAVPLS